jgi:DNA-binding HxlR family transcriptional regulator
MTPCYSPGTCQRISEVLARVGDKWSIVVILNLGDDRQRFNELKRAVGSISQRMLTLTLRQLERDGLVRRTVLPTMPPGVEYELTALGHSFLDAVRPIGRWAAENLATIDDARQIFDAQQGQPLPNGGHKVIGLDA